MQEVAAVAFEMDSSKADLELSGLALHLRLQHLLLPSQPLHITGCILITSSFLAHRLHQQVILLNDV